MVDDRTRSINTILTDIWESRPGLRAAKKLYLEVETGLLSVLSRNRKATKCAVKSQEA